MLDVVTFKWKPAKGYRSTFGPLQVNTLRAMVARHYAGPHRFTCVTDDPAGLDPRVRVVPLWTDHARLVSPHGATMPSCYRRLRLFARDAAELIGPRFVWLDLDTVITADVRPLWDRPEDFVAYHGTAGRNPYNGSMILLRAGARPRVWEEFNPETSPALARRAGFLGSDQAWLAACLGRDEAVWLEADGVISWRLHCRRKGGKLPPHARLVSFHGSGGDPWSPIPQRLAPWIAQHWRIGPEEAECSPEVSTADSNGTERPKDLETALAKFRGLGQSSSIRGVASERRRAPR